MSFATFVALMNWAFGTTTMLSTRTSSGVGSMQIGRVILKLDALTLATCSCSMVAPSLGNPATGFGGSFYLRR